MDSSGWYYTGDLSVMRDDGYVKIVGRNKDMIIRGGENIYPAEIEGILNQHESIIDAQVVGVQSKRLGEEVGDKTIKNLSQNYGLLNFVSR